MATATPQSHSKTVDNSPLSKGGHIPVEGEVFGRKKSATAKSWSMTMKLMRRIHLYSGLFMFPWVLMYGISGMFFNHPRLLTGDEVRTFSGADAIDGAFLTLPTAQEVAEDAVADINFVSEETGGPTVKLTEVRPAHFNNYFSFTVNADDGVHTVSLNPLTGDGEVRTENKTEVNAIEEPNLLGDFDQVDFRVNSLTAAQKKIPGLLEELGLTSGKATAGRRAPSVVFSAEIDGTPAVLTCNLGNGQITASPEDKSSEMSSKRFLQRLHLSRGYSPGLGLDWFWALSVDAMFVSMVFWGCSGIFMWWQIKRTRLMGAGVIVASVICASLLAFGMHDQMTHAAPRGGGHSHGGGGNRGGGGMMRGQAPGRSQGLRNTGQSMDPLAEFETFLAEEKQREEE